MFGVDASELFIVAIAALIFIGPKELPGAMRALGRWVGKARAHARHFTSGIENMMREAELEELEKRWREENERIMRDHPMSALPYAGAGENVTGASFSFASPAEPPTSPGTGEGADQPLGTGEAEARVPPPSTLDADEPGLPLPEPGHHRRELP